MATLGNLVVQIGASTKALDTALEKTAKNLERFGKKLQRDAKDITQVVSLPLAGFAAAALASSERATKAFAAFAEQTKKTFGKFGDEIAKAVNLEKVLGSASAGFERLFKWFNSLDESTKSLIVQVGFFVAAMGPMIVIVGKLATGLAAAITLLSGPLGIAAALGVVTIAIGNAYSASLNESFAKQLEADASGATAEAEKLRASLVGIANHVSATHTPAVKEVAEGYGELQKKFDTILPKFEDLQKAFETGAPDPTGSIAKPPQAAATADPLAGLALGVSPPALTESELFEIENYRAIQAELKLIEDQMTNISTVRLQSLSEGMMAWLDNLSQTAIQTGEIIASVFDSVAQGIGETLARAVVYGEEIGAMFKNLFKSILASLISYVTQAILQWTVLAIARKLLGVKQFSGDVGQASGVAAAWAAAHSVKSLGLAGIAAAPAFAAAASAITISSAAGAHAAGAGAGVGIAAAASGGLFDTPQITSIAERGPEIVLNKRNVEDFFGSAMPGGGGRAQQIGVYLDGRAILEHVVRGMPDMLRLYGAV